MEIAEIFYLTATVSLILITGLLLYFAYLVGKAVKTVGKTLTLVSATRYTLTAVALKTFLNLLGKGGENE